MTARQNETRRDYIVAALREAGCMYAEDAESYLGEHEAAVEAAARAAALRLGADSIEQEFHADDPAETEREDAWNTAVRAAATTLRQMANEAAAGQTPSCPDHGDPIECTCQARAGLDAWLGKRFAAGRTAGLLEGADAIDRETAELRTAGVLEPDRFRPCRDAAEQLRALAAAGQAPAPQPEQHFVHCYVYDGGECSCGGYAGGHPGPTLPAPQPCCHLHKPTGCCDPEDCGPCCEDCPTCPKLPRSAPQPEPEPKTTPAPSCKRCRGEKATNYIKNGGIITGCPACGLDNDGGCATCRHIHRPQGDSCGALIATAGMHARRCQCTGPAPQPETAQCSGGDAKGADDWATIDADRRARLAPYRDAEIARLTARIAELERPAIEVQRNEIRASFTELISQAEQDGDYEGAFNVRCRLREREEQWKAEDAPAPQSSPGMPYQWGATPIPAELATEVTELSNSEATRWLRLTDRDGEDWDLTDVTYAGDRVLLPCASDLDPMLLRDVQRQFGPLTAPAPQPETRCDHPHADAPGIRGLLEHVGIDTTGRDITVAGRVVDAAPQPETAPPGEPDGLAALPWWRCHLTRPHAHHLGCPGITTAEHRQASPPPGPPAAIPQTPEADRD